MTTTRELDRIADTLPMAYQWQMHRPNGLRYHDWFCGAGGSSLGMTGAGFELALAANHWDRAIETHSANFPTAEHLCADLTHYDLRLAPRADVLWASPICTEASPAGGTARAGAQEELELFGPIAKVGMERTRATFHEVIRSAQLFRYQAVIVENVADVATKWELFDWWVEGMEHLDYVVQYVSVSSAHIGSDNNPHAPQWRDRLYLVFTRKGAPLPDVEPRPLAWCDTCQEDVDAIQSWKKPGRHIGKYRQQYVYVCPRQACRHAVVEPYVAPAASVIDWTNLGTRVGDRKRPLAAKTKARIRAGLQMFAQPITAEVAGNTFERRPGVRTWPAFASPTSAMTTTATKALASIPPVVLATNHDGHGRAFRADQAPLPSRTTKIGEGIACAPFIAELRGGGSLARRVTDPLATVTAGGSHHGLTVPPGFERAFYVKNHGGNAQPKDMARSVADPFGTITTKDPTSLVIPFRRGLDEERILVDFDQLGLDVEDCLFRMLTPEEHLLAQRFHPSYEVKGSKGERTMQAGNAVSSNVAQWLGAAVAAALCGEDERAA